MVADPVFETRLFTVDEYELISRVGAFGYDERLELLDGKIVPMSPMGPRHAGVIAAFADAIYGAAHGRVAIRVQSPVRLPPRSEPEPDIVVAARRRDHYASAHPTAEDTLLVIEVSDSSLAFDREVKVPIYAERGIPEVWIVDLTADVVHVHYDPDGSGYRIVATVGPDGELTSTEVPELKIAVADIL